MNKLLVAFSLLTLPTLVNAQGLQTFATSALAFLNDIIIPFLLGIGFLFFLVNAIRFFVFGSAEQEGRDNAKQLAIYSVLGFVVIVVFWGIVNLLASTIGLDCADQPTPDYIDPDSIGNFSASPCGNTGTTGNNSASSSSPTAATTPNQPAQTGPNAQGNVACSLPTTSGAATTILTTPNNCQDLRDAGTVNLSTITSNGQMDLNDPDTWLGGIIRTHPRPWRDYFWTNWNRNGSNANNPMVECLLPDGTSEQLPENECEDLNGQVVSTNAGNGGTSFQLTNCTYTDANGQVQNVQVTAQDCQDLQAGSGTNTPSQPVNGTGSGNGNGGPATAPGFNNQIQ